jgi:hypothetical protein
MVYSDPYIHLSVADSHINYDLPRMRGNETPYIYIYIRLERSNLGHINGI